MRKSLAATVLAALLTGCARQPAKGAEAWNPDAAAVYLDTRADWWMTWRKAARDHGTFCISCHTTLPYALARPALRERATDSHLTGREQKVLDNVRTRVHHWIDAAPYYGARAQAPSKVAESRGTEAVLNALILADADAREGRLSDDTRLAFDHMWAVQETTGPRAGAWQWLQFGLEPWEGTHGEYFGAALAALATATAPERYESTPAIQGNISRLRAYLDREFDHQPLSNRAVLLWASTRMPALVDENRRARLVADLYRAQQRDGGWSLDLLDRHSGWTLRRFVARSDGYATGLVTLALLADGEDVARGVAWLARHQDPADGSWPAHSLNTDSPSPMSARFMNDAATAFAVLALTEAGRQVR